MVDLQQQREGRGRRGGQQKREGRGRRGGQQQREGTAAAAAATAAAATAAAAEAAPAEGMQEKVLLVETAANLVIARAPFCFPHGDEQRSKDAASTRLVHLFALTLFCDEPFLDPPVTTSSSCHHLQLVIRWCSCFRWLEYRTCCSSAT
ncbi:hypothetical protein FHG87_020193 [Trinorchestia longiramus]|nr:hypothetical protein FHG87_020193 [Trinorchestia longiramus]